MTLRVMLKRPSAYLPLAMSAAALALVLIEAAVGGTGPRADEGTAAHLWQLLMAGQLPFIVWFALRWVRQAPRQGMVVLGILFGAALAAAAPVFLLRWQEGAAPVPLITLAPQSGILGGYGISGCEERHTHDHRHRRARRLRQVHGREGHRRAPRCELPRHGRHVSGGRRRGRPLGHRHG